MAVEGHAEGGAGLVNFGVASDFSLWHYGVVSLAFRGATGIARWAGWGSALSRQRFGARA